MEDVLDLYESEYDKERPVVCVDEKPYQFLDEIFTPIPMNPEKAGKSKKDKKDLNIKKEDYEYKRNGTCNIFMISEPFNDYYNILRNSDQRKEKVFP